MGRSTTTDANGRFDLGPDQDDLTVYLSIRAPGYNSTLFRLSEAIHPPFELSPATKPEMELPLVITDESGAPIPKAAVSVHSHVAEGKAAQDPQGVLPEETDATGSVRIPIGKNWDNITLDIAAPGFAPLVTTPLPASERPQTIRLARGATVTGRLLCEAKPLAGITIEAKSKSKDGGTRRITPTTTDADGRFQLTAIPPGRNLVISPTLQSLAPYGVTPERLVDPLKDGQTLDLGDLPVSRGLKLAGRVHLTDGKTAETITLRLQHGELSDSLAVHCDEAGRFCFEHIAPGAVRLSVADDNYALTANNPCRDLNDMTLAEGRLTADKTDLLLELTPMKPGESPWNADFAPLHGVEKSPTPEPAPTAR